MRLENVVSAHFIVIAGHDGGRPGFPLLLKPHPKKRL